MIRKLTVLSVIIVLSALVISCEKDFQDIGSNVIGDTPFNTNKLIVEVNVTGNTSNEGVRADNIGISNLGEYLFGIYDKKEAEVKRIDASVISQLALPSSLQTEQTTDSDGVQSTYILDKVLLKIPYTVTRLNELDDKGNPTYKLDSVLGSSSTPMTVKVYQTNTFLNVLSPDNINIPNSFLSNYDYLEGDLLNDDVDFEFTPSANQTFYEIERSLTTGVVFNDTIKHTETSPFLVIPLNYDKMKSLFWDKFGDTEFATTDAFINYFRGLIIKPEDDEGFMIPLSLNGTNNPSLNFYYTITRLEPESEGSATMVYKDSITGAYVFPFAGVRNSKYEISGPGTSSSNNFVVQGTAGDTGEITILTDEKLQELRANNWLINDASLTFYIDDTSDTTKVPKRLFLFKKGTPNSHIKDAYSESSTYGGTLELLDGKPEKYTFRITDYISDLLKEDSAFNPSLGLKVFNSNTDVPVMNNVLDTIVKTYNWNPRSVNLLNHLPINGEKRVKLVISYSEDK